MKMFTIAALAATMLGGAALAEPVTRTTTYDGPRYEGTRVATRDREAGVYTRETDYVRKRDGATGSRDYTRTRTDTGFVENGAATRVNGKTYTLSGSRVRTDTGYTRDRSVVNGAGRTIYSRDTVVTRNGRRR